MIWCTKTHNCSMMEFLQTVFESCVQILPGMTPPLTTHYFKNPGVTHPLSPLADVCEWWEGGRLGILKVHDFFKTCVSYATFPRWFVPLFATFPRWFATPDWAVGDWMSRAAVRQPSVACCINKTIKSKGKPINHDENISNSLKYRMIFMKSICFI